MTPLIYQIVYTLRNTSHITNPLFYMLLTRKSKSCITKIYTESKVRLFGDVSQYSMQSPSVSKGRDQPRKVVILRYQNREVYKCVEYCNAIDSKKSSFS